MSYCITICHLTFFFIFPENQKNQRNYIALMLMMFFGNFLYPDTKQIQNIYVLLNQYSI
jgi:hypothetical protein